MKNRLNARRLCALVICALLMPTVALAEEARPAYQPVRVDKKQLVPNTKLPKNERSILLIVFDPLEGQKTGPATTMLLATIDTKSGKSRMTAMETQLLVDIDAAGRDTLAQTFVIGGENLAMRTVNKAFAMNVRDYVTVNLEKFADVVELVGGVYLTISDTDAAALGIASGNQTLTPVQKLGYMRLPGEGSDVDRPYVVIMQTLYQASRDKSAGKLTGMLRTVLGSVSTNIGLFDMIGLGSSVMGSEEREETRLPAPEQLAPVQMYDETCYETDLTAARDALHTFLFGQVIPAE